MDEERQGRYLKMAVACLVIFTIILLGAMTGLTYTVVASLKDTKVKILHIWDPLQPCLRQRSVITFPLIVSHSPFPVQLQDGTSVMISKAGDIIQVAHVNMIVSADGTLVQRPTLATDAANSGRRLLGSSATAGTENALRVSAFTGIQQPLTSAMDIDTLIELNYLHVSFIMQRPGQGFLFVC